MTNYRIENKEITQQGIRYQVYELDADANAFVMSGNCVHHNEDATDAELYAEFINTLGWF